MKKHMKLATLFLTMAMALSLASCSGGGGGSSAGGCLLYTSDAADEL